jgi:hypothetical protein
MAADIFAFVPHHFKNYYEKLGWEYHGKDDGFCACYVWRGGGAPILPTIEDWQSAHAFECDPQDYWGEADV